MRGLAANLEPNCSGTGGRGGRMGWRGGSRLAGGALGPGLGRPHYRPPCLHCIVGSAPLGGTWGMPFLRGWPGSGNTSNRNCAGTAPAEVRDWWPCSSGAGAADAQQGTGMHNTRVLRRGHCAGSAVPLRRLKHLTTEPATSPSLGEHRAHGKWCTAACLSSVRSHPHLASPPLQGRGVGASGGAPCACCHAQSCAPCVSQPPTDDRSSQQQHARRAAMAAWAPRQARPSEP